MGILGGLKNCFGKDNDEILFFILIFLVLFCSGMFGGEGICGDDSTMLFFIILFLLLFFNPGTEKD